MLDKQVLAKRRITMEQLKISNLKKSFGDKEVVKGISFTVNKGEIIGFLGANGAGKSTSIRMITEIEDRDDGEIYYCGKPIKQHSKEYLQAIGVVPQEIALYMDMSAYNNVAFFCSLYGYDKKEQKKRVEEALRFVGLWEHRKEKPNSFSGGMQRRLNIACSISHSPQILIMDEPTVGIDPQSRNYIMESIKELNRRGTSIIYVSHYMEEVEQLCSRIILLDHGIIIEDTSKENLKSKYQKMGLNTLEDIFLHITGKELRDGGECK